VTGEQAAAEQAAPQKAAPKKAAPKKAGTRQGTATRAPAPAVHAAVAPARVPSPDAAPSLPSTNPAAKSSTPKSSTTTTPPPATSSPACDEDTHYVNSKGNCVLRPVAEPSAPAGATAKCQDGTYSSSQSRSGTCSKHGGVAQWL
jgi:hypothetical protein